MTRYRYEIKNDKGYRLLVEKSNLNYFKKIVYDGLCIIYTDSYILEYNIEPQLIRKIKINKINKQTTRIENTILELLERSKEIEIDTNKYNISYGNSSYGTFYSCSSNYYNAEILENKKENKERNRLQSKIYSQKAKQYENKTRFRK